MRDEAIIDFVKMQEMLFIKPSDRPKQEEEDSKEEFKESDNDQVKDESSGGAIADLISASSE